MRGLLTAALIAVAGCATAGMPVPDALASAERMPVSGRQGWRPNTTLGFGSYRVDEVERSRVRGGDINLFGYKRTKRSQDYRFTIRDATGSALDVSCQADFRERAVDSMVGEIVPDTRSALACTITAGEGGEWQLRLVEEGEKPLRGDLRQGDVKLDVVGDRKIAGGILPAEETTGYQFLRDGRPVAAVEVINDGAAWLGQQLAGDRPAVAAAAAALLLMTDLRALVEQGG